MIQALEVQGFDFSAVPADKRERARELDAQCGDAIQKLSYPVDEIGDICKEMQGIMPYGTFMPWYRSRGLSHNQVSYAINRVKAHEQAALDIVEISDFQKLSLPEPVQSPYDDEKERKLTELEERLRTANERLAQAQAAQLPKTVEKRVEVTPQHVLDRQKALSKRVTDLETEAMQLRKQRDVYKRDLDKERQ